MRSTRPTLFAVALLTLLALTSAQADVRLPHVFASHMVLQQGKPVTVWGWAEPGESVSVQLGEAKQQTKATDKGEWLVTLPAPKPSAALTMTVTGKNTITLDDILVGEVWLCSGQSNMEMGITPCLNSKEEIAAANYPGIRLFLIPKAFNTLPQPDVNATWKICTPQTIVEGGWGGFSAAAYYFGRELHKTLNVPVGLICSAWGGTRIEPWTPPAGFAAVPALKNIYDAVLVTDPRTPEHQQRVDQYLKSLDEWNAASRKATADKTVLTPPPSFPPELGALKDQQQPTALYNAMIHGIQPLSLRGIIWYQGESNHGEGKLYTEKTKALVAGWRKVFNQDDLAFYYTMIAPFQYGTELPTVVPEFWEAQAAAMSIPNTGMIVTTDISELNDIHPRNKQEIGRRLALWALAKTYGKAGIVYSGPLFKSHTIEGNKVRLTFDHVGGGLISRDGKPLSHFELIDADKGGFVPATATIDGATVVLTSPDVPKPVAFRFAWHKLAEPNFANKEGLPAVPFRGGIVPNRDSFTLLGSETAGYQLVYDLNLSKLGKAVTYDVDQRAQVTKPFDRIGYFLELTGPDGKPQYLFASMDAFTTEVAKIGIPTLASGAVFQQKVDNLTVISNVPGITNGVGMKGGNIEFWPHNYGQSNSLNIPNASSQAYDFGDQRNEPADGYGSMQVHNFEAKQTLFAINNWSAGNGADIGIGNSPAPHTDWTFAKSGPSYTSKRLRVYVHYK